MADAAVVRGILLLVRLVVAKLKLLKEGAGDEAARAVGDQGHAALGA